MNRILAVVIVIVLAGVAWHFFAPSSEPVAVETLPATSTDAPAAPVDAPAAETAPAAQPAPVATP